MREKAKEIPVQRIEPDGEKNSYKIMGWTALLAGMLAFGGADVLLKSWGDFAPSGFITVGIAFAGLLSSALVSWFEKKYSYAWVGLIFPWLLTAAFGLFVRLPRGARGWFDFMIARWNLLQEGGTDLITVTAMQKDILAFTLLSALLLGQLAWILAKNHSMAGSTVLCVLLMLVEVVGGTFDPGTTGILLIVLLALNMSDAGTEVTRRCFVWLLGIGLLFAFGVIFLPKGEVESIHQFRTNVKQAVHEMRYGADTLPQGDLRKASELQKSEKTMMQIQSEQEKNLYLRGFVGSVYQDGVWMKMPDSAYGGENAGLLRWLQNKNFDPLTQVADYYKIGEANDTPDTNHILYQIDTASRYYMYFPSTLKSVIDGKVKAEQDIRMESRGILGIKNYAAEEVSGSRPSELTVAADWVSNPQTDKQKEYCEAEAVYRQFVYENYTKADADLADLIKDTFWTDYKTDSDGIYSALTHIREVMKEKVQYTENFEDTPKTEDPIREFLTGSGKGNAMLYASTAVEAFRLHGIPARYVEGYYVPERKIADSKDATVSLTGEDAHAWVEIYFDGIGWLPVDVTPGYYFESVALQQMVGTPDMVRKNASLENNSFDANQVTGTDGLAGKKQEIFRIAKTTLRILLGIAGILLIVGVLFFALAEILRVVGIWLVKKGYERSRGEVQVRKAELIIGRYLKIWGIESHLGWKTKETDRKVAKLIPSVKKGEYSRVCALLEKTIYGEEELEAYEKRTLNRFMEKISLPEKKSSLRMKLRLRYAFFKILPI